MAHLRRGYKRLCRPIIITALALSGSFNMISAVFADGTAAGTVISNTATATYTDPENQILTTTSNTVEVTIAEVAGVTVTATGAVEAPAPDSDGDTILEPSEQVQFTYDITNVGNDLTDISLPVSATPTGPITTVDTFEFSVGGGPFTAFTSRTVVENIEPGESVQVRVTATVSANAESGDAITLTYGDTPGNAQNQPYDNSGGSIFTADTDNDDTITDPADPEFGEANTQDPPRNGEREAAAVAEIVVDELPLQQPLVQLSKTGGVANDATPATPTDPTDDTISYDLAFSVLNTDPTGSGATPADLQPITLDVDGSTNTQYVLVSDAVPEGATVDITALPTPAGGWTVVYTSDAVTTNALEAAWTTTAPTNTVEAQAVTRIGFIGPADTAIALNETVTVFTLQVVTDRVDSSANPIIVANIAQVFGSGAVDDPITPEDESLDFPVMDESGDQTPSNYNPIEDTFSNFNPDALDNSGPDEVHDGFTPDDGFIDDPSDLANIGTDTSQDNTGTGDDGEALVTVLVPEVASDLLNGPDSEPDAIGPTGTNDDFTNKSTPFAEGEDPAVVAFTNTLDNDSATSGWVKLEPTPPTEFLPAGTTATILADDINGNPVSATYTFDGAAWSTSDPEVYVPIGANDEADPLDPANGGTDQITYGVEVDLPLDDDAAGNVAPLTGYPVPIEASFVPVGVLADGSAPTQAEMSEAGGLISATNTTIDRVYTGFIELLKTVQVLQGDGPTVSGDPAPGNILRYRIQYENVSEQETGTMSGNVTLFAQNLDILEDGTERACDYATLLNANNWALDNDDDNGDSDAEVGTLDTSHVLGGVNLTAAEAGSVVVFYSGGAVCDGNSLPDFNPATALSTSEQSGTSINTDVTKYLFGVGGDIQPGESGFVEFDRLVN